MSDNQQLLQQVLQRYGMAGANIQLIRSYNNDVYRDRNRRPSPLWPAGLWLSQHETPRDGG